MTDGDHPIGDYQALRTIAIGVVDSAVADSRVLTALGRPATVSAKSSPASLVSGTDLALDRAVRSTIRSCRPDDGVLSEESPEDRGDSGYRWVVDPIDGTTNFVQGIPHFCVSVACERRDRGGCWRTVAAAVHDPVRSETFSAARGGGAYLGAVRLRLDGPAAPSEAVVATELSYHLGRRPRQLEQLHRVVPMVRDVRMTGSSALDLCWTACGRFGGFWEDELERWDWSAGALLVTEAGGRVSPIGTGVIAGAVAVHDLLSRLVN